MKHVLTLFHLILLLLLIPVNGLAQDNDVAHPLVLIYSNNVHGEIEPCG